jgi:aminopeptidase N
LIFLSSYAFLTDQQREQLHYEPYRILLQHVLPAHETAHQWWGDLVTWSSYRDQWFSEGLAHYCSLMMVQERNPAGFREVMEQYRHEMVEKNKDGLSPMDAGPVTLGTRLLSSRSPQGYDAINYGRGTWLFHMLRSMLSDGTQEDGGKIRGVPNSEEPFVRALRKVRERYEGKAITTKELLDVFAEELPPSLQYEGKRSLDWFLDGWINGTSLPRFELKGVKYSVKGKAVVVSGTILQKDAPEDLVTSVPLYGMITGRQPVFLKRVFADGEESTFRIVAPAGTHKILIDPNETVLTAPKQ